MNLFQYDSNNWTFFRYDQKILNFFFEYDSKNFFFEKYDSQNWTLLIDITQRIEPFFKRWQKIDHFSVDFFKMTQGIELLIWLKELNLFSISTQRIELFFDMTQRIELFFWQLNFFLVWLNWIFQYDTPNWTLSLIWRKELDPFSKYYWKNWTFFLNITERIELFFWILLKELNLFFLKKTERIELLFLIGLEELNFLLNTTQQIQPFFYWLKELKFFQCGTKIFSQTWLWAFNPFFLNDSFWKAMTHRIEPFLLIWLTEWNPSFQFDSKNWTLFNIWLEELNIFFKRTFSIWLKRLIFSICFEELNPFLIWPNELTFFKKWDKCLIPFWTWLTELNFFIRFQ